MTNSKQQIFSEAGSGPSIRRRSFLSMSILGLTGLSLPSFPAMGAIVSEKLKKVPFVKMFTGAEKTYWERTDPFEVKKELLRSAWEAGDFRAVRALANSIRISGIQAQIAEETPGLPISQPGHFNEVASLPSPWQSWAKGWKYCKILNVEEQNGFKREREPVEVLLGFQAAQVNSLQREIRLARVTGGYLQEIPSQVFGEVRRGDEWFCNLIFQTTCGQKEKQTFVVFYGNPDAELPDYKSDLAAKGEEYRLDVENNFYKVELSRQAGQIERVTFKRNAGMELYAGGDGHGEPGGLDWSHDYYASGGFQKFRTALWDEVPDYEVIRGPVCTIVRRWGFPYSPLHPLFSPSRLNIEVEYRFYAGLPYFQKSSKMTALKGFETNSLRDEEWVFPAQTLPEVLWVGPDGKLNIGNVDPKFKDNLWGAGFFNKQTNDAFIALYLDHHADGIRINHTGSPNSAYYPFHGQSWSRHAVLNQFVPEGAKLYQKNAYLTTPFNAEKGPAQVEKLRSELLAPLKLSPAGLSPEFEVRASQDRLARPGENQDSPISKRLLWEALEKCKDPQLYKADISIVELGFVYDINVEGSSVHIVLAMPHKGRPLGEYFVNGSNTVHNKLSLNIPDALLQVPGVENVTVEQSWYPGWHSNLITETGRKKLELP